jgi:hypothetical protein
MAGEVGNFCLKHGSRLFDANLQTGAVIPVTAGMMRNIWYPKKMAEYLTTDKLQQLGVKKDTAVERDSTFKSNTERKLDKENEKFERKVAAAAAESTTASMEQEPEIPIELDLLSVRLPTVNPNYRIWMLIFG